MLELMTGKMMSEILTESKKSGGTGEGYSEGRLGTVSSGDCCPTPLPADTSLSSDKQKKEDIPLGYVGLYV